MNNKFIVFICCIFLFTGCAAHSVKITSSPSGAKFVIDGEDKGFTPATVRLQHTTFAVPTIKLSKEGYETLETRMQYVVSAPAIILDVLFFTPLLFFNVMCPGHIQHYDLVNTG